MNSESREFSTKVLIFLSISFMAHLILNAVIGVPIFQHQIIHSYTINAALAVGIFWGLTSLKTKYSNQIGFMFLASSFIKFFVFFMVFYSPYNADGKIVFLEFVSFFIPYTICLILETYFLSKQLNQM